MRVATVRIVSPADPAQFVVINESDLADDHELWPEQEAPDFGVRYLVPADGEAAISLRLVGKIMASRAGVSLDEWRGLPISARVAKMRAAEVEIDGAASDTAADSPLAARVAKGPRGRWYVWRGKVRITEAFETEAEARAALEAKVEANGAE